MYKIDSPHAEEFINHDEIMATLDYAKANKDNRELIRSIIDKARDCKGLSHREAAVLLECDDNDLLEEIYTLAREIKQRFYGNRIVMFAPLYLSNYCVNSCVYCPYHIKTSRLPARSLLRMRFARKSLHCKIWDINVLLSRLVKIRCIIR